jgi:molybdate transport system ATP-binding protein
MIVTARADEVPQEATHVLLVHRGRIALAGPRGPVLRSRAFHEAMRPPRNARLRKVGSGRGRPREPVIEMRDVSIRYGRVRALDRVSWTVRRGERWAVLGPNGAGKTTLLSLVLADHPQAYANDLRLFGARRGSGESIWDIKRRIGCVSPESHLFHERRGTALEAVCSGFHDAAGLYRACSPRERAEAKRWLRRMGLSRLVNEPLGRLSEGEQRLVLLARALVKRPEMLVLDEPCQGLDSTNRRRFLRVLETLLRRSRLTVLYVTHEREEIPAGFTRVMLLERGQARAGG